jgi:hypothetical protein
MEAVDVINAVDISKQLQLKQLNDGARVWRLEVARDD